MNEEYHIQTAFVHWLRSQHPNILFTIAPNGMKLPIQVAKKMKAMGYLKGTPDIIIFEARKGFNGLLIELKTEKGRLTKEQKIVIPMLNDRGYKTVICRSCEEAILTVEKYLK